MAFGQVTRKGDRPGWYLRFTWRGRRVWRKAGPSKRIARQALADLEACHARGYTLAEAEAHAFGRKAGVPTLKALCALYIEHARPTLKASTARDYASRVDILARSPLGARACDELTTEQLSRWLESRAARLKLAPASYNRLVWVARAVLDHGKALGHIKGDNAADRLRKRRETPRRTYPSPSVVTKLVEHASRPVRVKGEADPVPVPDAAFADLLRFLAYTGCRRGEALGARWSDVREGVLTLRPEAVKTATSARSIPLVGPLGEVVARLKARRVSLDPDAPLFAQTAKRNRGAAWTPTFVTSRWKATLEAARTAGVAVPAGLRLHDLRRGTATALLAAGVDLAVVQEVLGHSSPAVTKAVYALVESEAKVAAMGRLGASFG